MLTVATISYLAQLALKLVSVVVYTASSGALDCDRLS